MHSYVLWKEVLHQFSLLSRNACSRNLLYSSRNNRAVPVTSKLGLKLFDDDQSKYARDWSTLKVVVFIKLLE